MIGRPRVIAISRSSFAGSAGGAGHVELEIAGGDDVAAAERGEAFGIGLRLREANVEARQQRRDGAVHPPPARERARRHPPVDQHHRHPAHSARQDQVRPQVGFDEQRQRRLPMVEEARDIARGIIRHVLMDDVGRKTLCHDGGRGDRARGEQDAQIEVAQPLDQRGRGQDLADAGAVDPDQRAVRAHVLAEPAPLADARGIFLALLQPPLDQRRRERHQARGQAPIHPQRHGQRLGQRMGQRISHLQVPGGQAAHRRGGSLRSACLPTPAAAFPSWRHRHPAARGFP